MRRVQPDLVKLAKRYAGQWVAIDHAGCVIAAGASAREVVEAAEAEGIDLPLILYVLDDYGRLAPCHA